MTTLIERDQAVIWHPFSPMRGGFPLIEIASAFGATLVDSSGKRYLDAISSWWTNLHGHCHPEIVDAIREQAGKLDHVLFAGCTHGPAVTLAEQLVALVPLNRPKCFFSDDGSTAVETALKIAVQYWSIKGQRRSGFVALRRGYHGDTFGAMAAGERGAFSEPFSDLLMPVQYLDLSAPLDELQVSAMQIFATRPAAIIYEPLVQGVGEMSMADRAAYELVLRIARQHEVLLIADEVMTGFGRTGTIFASEQIEPKPNLMCLAKGLSGGVLPLAVTIAGSEVWECFDSAERSRTLLHGHSFTANAIACAAAIKSLEMLQRPDACDRRKSIEASHQTFARHATTVAGIQNPRVCGTIFACEIGDPAGYFSAERERIYRKALERGVLLRPLGNTVYLMPPYCVRDEELATLYALIEEIAQ